MANNIDQLLVSLKLLVDKESFDNAKAALKDVTNNALSMASSVSSAFNFSGLAKNIYGFSTEMSKAILVLDRLARNNNLSIENLVTWQSVFESLGASAGNARAIIEKFGQLKADVISGKVTATDLQQAGIDPFVYAQQRDTHGTIAMLVRSIGKMSPTQKESLGQLTQLTAQDMTLLAHSEMSNRQKAYEARSAEASPHLVSEAKNLNDTVKLLDANMKGLALEVGGPVMENMNRFLHSVDGWLVDNRKGVASAITGTAPHVQETATSIALLTGLSLAKKYGPLAVKAVPAVAALNYGQYIYQDRENVWAGFKSSRNYMGRTVARMVRHMTNQFGDELYRDWGLDVPWRTRKKALSVPEAAMDIPFGDERDLARRKPQPTEPFSAALALDAFSFLPGRTAESDILSFYGASPVSSYSPLNGAGNNTVNQNVAITINGSQLTEAQLQNSVYQALADATQQAVASFTSEVY